MKSQLWLCQLNSFCTNKVFKSLECTNDGCLIYYLQGCLSKDLNYIEAISESFSLDPNENLAKFFQYFQLHVHKCLEDNIEDSQVFKDLIPINYNFDYQTMDSNIQNKRFFQINPQDLNLQKFNLRNYLNSQDTLIFSQVSTNFFIILEDFADLDRKQIIDFYQKTISSLETDKDETGESRKFHLSSIVLFNKVEPLVFLINDKRLWDSPDLKLSGCSLFELLSKYTMYGFFPIQLQYTCFCKNPYKISIKAWDYSKRLIGQQKLKTFKCGKIREENCECCGDIQRFGWLCDCGRVSKSFICECGESLSICRKCNNFKIQQNCQYCYGLENISNEEIENTETLEYSQKYSLCEICSAPFNHPWPICVECLNPKKEIFMQTN